MSGLRVNPGDGEPFLALDIGHHPCMAVIYISDITPADLHRLGDEMQAVIDQAKREDVA